VRRNQHESISRVDWKSLGLYFAGFYGSVGFIVGAIGSLSSSLLTVPIGFAVPFLHLVVNLNAPRGTGFYFFLLAVSPFLNAITGFISGTLCAVVYNFVATYGFTIRGATAKTSESSL
jgi:hypothetical protein